MRGFRIQKKDKIMNNNFEIQVLVNGNKCKQYYHNGRTFIEAKHGTEYELEIRNNNFQRVLCIGSVDGLNVLNGKPASEEDTGYVIPCFSPLKIKGFRYSNDEVAAFKFSNKNDSYAHSQGGNESSINCGVIGFKLYSEIVKLPLITWKSNDTVDYWDGITTTCDSGGLIGMDYKMDKSDDYRSRESVKRCSSSTLGNSISTNSIMRSVANFDMGSTWGQKVQSKVVETTFEKGLLSFSTDIYYASRQALIDMGVPIYNQTQVSFPQSFPKKYATPPVGWNG